MGASIAKKEQVRVMFNNIAGKYDFLNHFLSAGIDKVWRKKLVKMVAGSNPKQVLDVATGTADLAIELSSRCNVPITGVDIAQGMLDIGAKKLIRKGLNHQIRLQLADSESLPSVLSDLQFVSDVDVFARLLREFPKWILRSGYLDRSPLVVTRTAKSALSLFVLKICLLAPFFV